MYPAGVPTLALLVDRDANTRQLYAAYLEDAADWRIEEAADGREALAKAYSVRPDVIITETRLPGISGYDLCDLLRRDAVTERIRRVVVTGDAYPTNIAEAKAAGADAVLTKPCLPETLLAEVQRLLAASVALRERGASIRARVADQMSRAQDALRRSEATARKLNLKESHLRGQTTVPPRTPPELICPGCDTPLHYQRSHIGGVSSKHAEQWDYFKCNRGCGTFQYRSRTRAIRKVK
jgi:CheY-like chemotaxis protein